MRIQLQYTTEAINNNYGHLNVPCTATEFSSGYDLTAISDPEIVGETYSDLNLYKRVDYIQYRTGIQIGLDLDSGFHTLILPRSSISKYNLQLANSIGLIDCDYRGELLLRFNYTWQPQNYVYMDNKMYGVIDESRIYKKGDKIGQLIAEQSTRIDFDVVYSLSDTVRGSGGFGHSGI